MKVNDFIRSEVDEVAMNPTAYAQSLEIGQQKGVLVGYEFEVCVPEATIKGGGKPAADKDSMAWMRNVPSAWYDYDYDADIDYYGAAKVLEPALTKSFGKVKVFDSYHERKKDSTSWYIEPDGSLHPTNDGDGAAEVVSPPMPANTAIDALKKFYGIAGQLKLYTNQSTGLHINVSVPDNLDILKLALFVGDQYVLKSWGREDNEYAQSVIRSLQQNTYVIGFDVKHKPNLVLLQKMAKDIAGDHYASTSYNGKWVSFRHTGGDYLKDMTSVLNVVGRFVRAMVIASDPNAYKKEYLTKLTALVGTKQKPTGYSYSDIAKLKQFPVEAVVTLMYGIPKNITPEKLLKGYKNSLADMNSNLLSNFIPLSPELTKILTDKWYNTVYNSVKETTKLSLDRNGHTRNAIIWNSGSRKEDLTITGVNDGNRWDPRRLGLQVSPKITLKPGTPEHTEYVNSIIQQYKQQKMGNPQQPRRTR